ncbi:cytochrome c3 family protein [Candidatus Poribacteria bacterium]|nr:cytochrome c3 family protein [Candidatus Poribacteria bacterium]
MKRIYLLAVCFLCVMASLTFALDDGPDKINLNAQEHHKDVIKTKDKKKVDGFPHKLHQTNLKGKQKYAKFEYTDDWTCGACHHTSKKGEQPVACFKCKEVGKMIEKVGGEAKFEKLFHDNCRDACHKAMEKDKQKTGPTKCKGCHGGD